MVTEVVASTEPSCPFAPALQLVLTPLEILALEPQNNRKTFILKIKSETTC